MDFVLLEFVWSSGRLPWNHVECIENRLKEGKKMAEILNPHEEEMCCVVCLK